MSINIVKWFDSAAKRRDLLLELMDRCFFIVELGGHGATADAYGMSREQIGMVRGNGRFKEGEEPVSYTRNILAVSSGCSSSAVSHGSRRKARGAHEG